METNKQVKQRIFDLGKSQEQQISRPKEYKVCTWWEGADICDRLSGKGIPESKFLSKEIKELSINRISQIRAFQGVQ